MSFVTTCLQNGIIGTLKSLILHVDLYHAKRQNDYLLASDFWVSFNRLSHHSVFQIHE